MPQWQSKGRYFQTNGTHNVAANSVMGVWRFAAWRLTRGYQSWHAKLGRKNKPELIGIFDTALEARQACEADR